MVLWAVVEMFTNCMGSAQQSQSHEKKFNVRSSYDHHKASWFFPHCCDVSLWIIKNIPKFNWDMCIWKFLPLKHGMTWTHHMATMQPSYGLVIEVYSMVGLWSFSFFLRFNSSNANHHPLWWAINCGCDTATVFYHMATLQFYKFSDLWPKQIRHRRLRH